MADAEGGPAWTPRRRGRRGGQRRYSALALETTLTRRLIYHLPLRQAERFLNAVFAMMHLDLAVPNDSTLSRRGQHLPRRLRPVPPGDRIHLVLDSTGLGQSALDLLPFIAGQGPHPGTGGWFQVRRDQALGFAAASLASYDSGGASTRSSRKKRLRPRSRRPTP